MKNNPDRASWLHRLRSLPARRARLPVDQHHPARASPRVRSWFHSPAGRPGSGLGGGPPSPPRVRSTHCIGRRPPSNWRCAPAAPDGHADRNPGRVRWLDQLGLSTADADLRPPAPTYAAWQRLGRERIDPARFPLPCVAVLGSDARRPLRTRADWRATQDVLSRVNLGAGRSAAFPEAGPRRGRRAHRPRDGSGRTGDTVLWQRGDRRPGPSRLARTLPAVPRRRWRLPRPRPEGPWERGRRRRAARHRLAGGGFAAVVSVRRVGSGGRSREADRYYQRHPHGSLLRPGPAGSPRGGHRAAAAKASTVDGFARQRNRRVHRPARAA